MDKEVADTNKPVEQAAATFSRNDVDIDIPIDDAAKEAVRWLIAQAFVAGSEWQEIKSIESVV